MLSGTGIHTIILRRMGLGAALLKSQKGRREKKFLLPF